MVAAARSLCAEVKSDLCWVPAFAGMHGCVAYAAAASASLSAAVTQLRPLRLEL